MHTSKASLYLGVAGIAFHWHGCGGARISDECGFGSRGEAGVNGVGGVDDVGVW